MSILIIEDDPRITSFVKRGLEAEGFIVDHADEGHAGISKAINNMPSLIILDVMLPDISGLEVCKQLRQQGIDTPILMLTALDTLDDKVDGLRSGADDYLTKPFAFAELLARIEAQLRRNAPKGESRNLQLGNVRIDDATKQVFVKNEAVPLTTKEYALLHYFMSNVGVVLSRADILKHVWGQETDPLTNVVDVCVFALRKKIGLKGGAKIETVRGFGYKLTLDMTEEA